MFLTLKNIEETTNNKELYQDRKLKHCITILACFPESELLQLQMVQWHQTCLRPITFAWAGCVFPVWLSYVALTDDNHVWLHGWRVISHTMISWVISHQFTTATKEIMDPYQSNLCHQDNLGIPHAGILNQSLLLEITCRSSCKVPLTVVRLQQNLEHIVKF